MCSKTWAKWLSGIALLFALSDMCYRLTFTFGEDVKITSLSIGVFLLAIVAVITAFSKDKAKKK